MANKRLLILITFLTTVLLAITASSGIETQKAGGFDGEDLHLAGTEFVSYQLSKGEQIAVFANGFSMSIGANRFSSDNAVVWLKAKTTEFSEGAFIGYEAKVYLKGNVSVKKTKNAKTTNLNEMVIEQDGAVVIGFDVSGDVFVTADKRKIADVRQLELYKKALAAEMPVGPAFAFQLVAQIQEFPAEKEQSGPPISATNEEKQPVKPAKVDAKPKAEKKQLEYPVNIAPVGEAGLELEKYTTKDGIEVLTAIGRLYVWQRQEVDGQEVLLELLADSAVVWYSKQEPPVSEEQSGLEAILAGVAVKAIYLTGDVVVTEGQRTIRADELYYDFERKKALAINAVMRSFDVERGIPIYVRAAKLRQLVENKFSAENITLTSSEFYKPQISLSASSVIITDTTAIDAELERVSDSSFDAEMRDVRLKVDDMTVFYWPFMRSNLQRPDIPLKSIHAGYDNTWGPSVETRWHLARLLGLQQPEGTDSTFGLDYYGKRGLGSGVEIDYKRDDYFGRFLGYIIDDHGEDRLGRDSSRKNLEPERELRGRFRWQHRHFLPYNWQLTTEASYTSDRNFIESYYRNEFNVGKEQETLAHLKRIEDNWGLSILGKVRINNFADELEEQPSVEFHLTGESLLDDKLTLYSDGQVSRFRQRLDPDNPSAISQEFFTFAMERAELDMPMRWGRIKAVPFVAGTFGYDDRSGFARSLVAGSGEDDFGEDEVWIGEAGIRLFPQPYWKIYPDIKSRLWDLNGLRHIIKPQLTAVVYEENSGAVEQRDTLNFAVFQRFQTRRGPAERQRTVDWIELDMDVTWVKDSARAGDSGPDRFIWNRPIVPLRVLSAPDILQRELRTGFRRFEMFGPRRNYFGADLAVHLSDTTAALSDMNFDMQSGVVQQFNIGLSRLQWPNLQFYLGSRYLRRIEALDEKGSNAFTFAATYVLDPRYRVVFSQQFDFDYGENCRSDIALIRRYHRMYWGLTLSVDESLDSQAIVFSIWPQGVPELAIGPRRYMGLGGSAGY